jgi:hypothetical protein
MCSASGWSTMASSTTQNLWGVWGSSASAVWAVGEGGTAVFYDGVQWQVQAPPSFTTVWSVSGTTASNVFASDDNGNVYKWNGSSWSLHVNVPVSYAGVFVDGIDSLWIGGQTGGSTTTLYRSVNGTAHLVGTVAQSDTLDNNGAGVWASSPTDVWVTLWGGYIAHYNGTSLTNTTEGANPVWGASASAVFFADFSGMSEWTGAGFTMINTGLNGDVNGLAGTAANRVFAAGQLNTGGGVVLLYNGAGITQQAIPAHTPQLNAVWAAPTGEVFAVGQGGAIIKGP